MVEQEIDLHRPLGSAMREVERLRVEIEEKKCLTDNPVIEVCKAIKKYIEAFEKELDDEHEIAVTLTSFGGLIIFHAEHIGFSTPNLITFYGITEKGKRVQLIQHVSQLNFLLKAEKKIEEKALRIGFI